MPHASTDPADDLTRALTDALRETIESIADPSLDPAALATRLAAPLSARIAAAAGAAGASMSGLARGLGRPSTDPAADTVEARVIAALQRYPSGRSSGVAPEVLRNLTGLPQSALGPAVSALVQAGELVRDAWMVRLPNPDDLLPNLRPAEGRGDDISQAAERRAIGDRRATGDRRLYERRNLPEP